MEYEIFTDASADIVRETIESEQIRIIPMVYDFGEESRTYDGKGTDKELKEFYDGERQGKVVRSSQINPGQYRDAFEPFAKEGKSILYLSLSGGLSSTSNSSVNIANELNELYPNSKIVCVDSVSATIGMGLIIERAIKNRSEGMSLEDNAKDLDEFKFKVCHWFMVDDLMFLKRGGRIPAGTAIVGKILNIKPLLRIFEDGTLVNIGKKTGLKAGMNELLNLYRTHTTGGENERVIIVHSDCPDNADYLEKGVLDFNPTAKVSKLMLTPIIGVHVGPGMCAIVHEGERKN